MVLLAVLLLAQPTAVRATRMFDARRGVIVQPGLVVVEGERIVQAGGTAPSGARTIDLGDATLLPGLMDAHTHLTFESGPSWYRDSLDLVLRWPAEQAQYAAEYARRTVESGFTAVRDLGAGDFIDVGLKKAIDAGAVVGPRMITAVHAVGSRGGHADIDPYPPDRVPPLGIREGICDGAEACRSAVRWQVKYGAGVIKLVASGGVLSLADPVDNVQLSQAELDAIVDEAHRWGRKAAAHCHGDAAAKMLVRAGVDSIEHGTFLKPDTLQEMKERSVVLIASRREDHRPGRRDIAPRSHRCARAPHRRVPGGLREGGHRVAVQVPCRDDARGAGLCAPDAPGWLHHRPEPGRIPVDRLRAQTRHRARFHRGPAHARVGKSDRLAGRAHRWRARAACAPCAEGDRGGNLRRRRPVPRRRALAAQIRRRRDQVRRVGRGALTQRPGGRTAAHR